MRHIEGQVRGIARMIDEDKYDKYCINVFTQISSVSTALRSVALNLLDEHHALIDPLATKPGRTSDPRGLGYADAITGTINALYTPLHWKYLTSGLLGLQRGTDAGYLLLLADDYNGRNRNGHYTNEQDAVLDVNTACRRIVDLTDAVREFGATHSDDR
ncbi:metal-sensitive transcriptional regulator [Actinomadura welshii]